ncbi:hypothetical protein A3L21_17570 [Pantoea agglomerans]|nr:hypothetical protein A3L21_17570 [Pantoea agglomerans]
MKIMQLSHLLEVAFLFLIANCPLFVPTHIKCVHRIAIKVMLSFHHSGYEVLFKTTSKWLTQFEIYG